MNLEKIQNEVLEKEDNFVVLENGAIIHSSLPITNLTIDQNMALKVIHFIDKNVEINIEIASGISAKIEEIYYSVKNDVRINTNIKIADYACLDYLNFERNDDDKKVITNINIHLGKEATINNKSIALFDGAVTSNQFIYLDGEGAINDSINVIINSSEIKQDYTYHLYHQVPNTTSNMVNYAICKKKSLLNANTHGIIVKGAKNTSLSQKVKGLLMDFEAMISANPKLQIDEYDCIASHGASIGAIDEDELYYLMSRGLTKEASETLIVEGFINPFLLEVKDEKFQDYIKYWSSKHI
ncbi:MAG: SufD family Fe-S cluster assembly protein [Bacilli bacterium]|jgi:Fe-S cluster assembly protein SufD|nr:SufD family Fe-S cluster assembly protein [Bacilli bacterium]MDD3348348.1 SufD family Fe-S cluster assembly protein [Bacilli bacterium]